MKMLRKPSSKDGWYELSPGDAQRILDERAPNRPITEKRAMALSDSIKAGAFQENGESIIFDDKDRLIDGQHRMRAAVLANKGVVTYCIFGVPSKLVYSIDDGTKRTAGDVLSMNSYQNAIVCAGVARLLYRYMQPGSIASTPNGSIPNRHILEVAKRNKDIQDAVDAYMQFKGVKDILSPSVGAFGFLMARRESPPKAAEFFEKLGSGAGLSKGSPILTLRNRFVSLKGEKHKIKQTEVVALMIKAWNAFLSGREMKLARYSGKAINEVFPRFGEEETVE